MLKKEICLLVLSLLISHVCLAQEPCKTAPMQGYTGKCNVSVVQAADGEHFYSSDQVTLKKWDLNTMKVVEEINDFPYVVHSITNDPDILEVRKFNVYSHFDLKQRGDWKATLLANPYSNP